MAFAIVIGITFILTTKAPTEEKRSVEVQQVKLEKTVEELIADASLRYGIDHAKFLATAQCESSLRSNVIGGDDGNSVGLFQIHLPSHPEVSMENALDPIWAVEWAAKKFKIDPTIWVCYNKLYGIQK